MDPTKWIHKSCYPVLFKLSIMKWGKKIENKSKEIKI